MSGPAEAVISLYERNARRFDKDRLKILFEKGWLDRFLALSTPGDAILDIGCGSGEPMARYLIENRRRVTGVDSSVAMIAMCRERFPDHEWLVADMRSLALGRRFGGLVAWDSFFHLTQDAQRRMFSIFAAHAAPQAPLMFTSGLELSESVGSYAGEPLYHASLSTAEYRSLIEASGFEVVRQIEHDPECDRHCVWLARLRT
ncbi:MAG TPA: class I SAM-dependent methyltransferase [Reyranella sp.]|nr:class I SAM-dependent methyltransferase [Reyranella sp.]